jgi:hypothetical protein
MSSGSVALLHRFDAGLHALFLPAVALAVLLWITALFLFTTGKRDWRPFPGLPSAYALSVGSFAAIVLFFIVTESGIEWLVMRSVRPGLLSKINSVMVEGHPIEAPQMLVSDLRKIPNGSDHHSHRIRTFRVVLNTEKGVLTLLLERDSGDPGEYWVYDPEFRSCYLGKIHTEALDGL